MEMVKKHGSTKYISYFISWPQMIHVGHALGQNVHVKMVRLVKIVWSSSENWMGKQAKRKNLYIL